MAFRSNVFVNCPFDKDYVDLLRPLVFCILALEFNPRIALERPTAPRCNWLAQFLDVPPPRPSELWARFNEFTASNYMKLKAKRYSHQDIEDQPLRELIKAMRDWLRPAPKTEPASG